jgi:hypothetical protein
MLKLEGVMHVDVSGTRALENVTPSIRANGSDDRLQRCGG